ncbi:MAG: CPBP family intramembrane metalloprotease [Oscillospiraceae bacterium]|nr:CPBP family intramembrane metalloprotease [Oscillospiraceae bacterium]
MEENFTPNIEIPEAPDIRLKSYKTVCLKLGLIMCVFYVCKLLDLFVANLLYELAGDISITAVYISRSIIAVMFVYMIPMLVSAILFKSFGYYSGKLGALYKKPKRLARALGSFPAMYGLGYGTAILTMLSFYIVSKFAQNSGAAGVEEYFTPLTMEPTTNLIGALMMVFMAVIIAPVFEEFFVRGIIYDALKPYGAGTAIIISAVLFGLMHDNLYMLFYTTALGFALGYIRYATDSLFAVTVLHALFNAVSSGLLLLMSLAERAGYENKLINSMLAIYQIVGIVLVILGIAMFIRKIPVIRKYKIENAWSGISPGKKIAVFCTSVSVFIMFVLAFNAQSNHLLLGRILKAAGIL